MSALRSPQAEDPESPDRQPLPRTGRGRPSRGGNPAPTGPSIAPSTRVQELEAELKQLRAEADQLRQMVSTLMEILAEQERQESEDGGVIDYLEQMDRNNRLHVGM